MAGRDADATVTPSSLTTAIVETSVSVVVAVSVYVDDIPLLKTVSETLL